MNDNLKNIIELGQLDKQNEQHQNDKAKARIRLEELLRIQDGITKEQQLAIQKVENAKNDISKNETYLEELKAKLDSVSEKTGKVKTEKEAKALALEEDIAKEQITFANDEIKRYEKIIDNAQAQNDEIQGRLDEVQKDIEDEQKSVKAHVSKIEKEANKVEKNRKALVAQIDDKALVFYSKITGWAGSSAVVPVMDQICHGCFIELSDQAYLDILKQEDVTTCPHCGRILYHQDVQDEVEEEAPVA